MLRMRPEKKLLGQDLGRHKADFLLYSDADKRGRIGVVCIDIASGRCEFARTNVPRGWQRRLASRRTQINAFELAGVLCGISTFGNVISGKRGAIFVDNQSALNILIKGWSRKQDLNDMAADAWIEVARLGCHVEWLYVPSKLNPADAPSRGKEVDLY